VITRLTTLDEVMPWLQARGVRGLQLDSRKVRPADAFLAWPGAHHDGRTHAAAALAQGAAAVLVEAEGAQAFAFDDPRMAAVPGLKALAGPIADRFEGGPSQQLCVVGITGTNGKTSTAWWLAQWFEALGTRCAVAGTLGLGRPGTDLQATGLTTPNAVQWQQGLRQLLSQGVQACAVEVSSIGLAESRLAGTRFHTAVFTNLSQDHLDYHGDMARYWAAKRQLFDWPGLRAAVVDIDDLHGQGLARELGPRQADGGLTLWTVGVQNPQARLQVRQWSVQRLGMRAEVVERSVAGAEAAVVHIEVPFVGAYNLHNLLCAMAVLRVQGHALARIAATIGALTAVPGRMQPVVSQGHPLVLVDYAHTPDAITQALKALRPMAQARAGALWCLLGCGGNRDAGKRPLMAAAAEAAADAVVLTSDNPRDEEPMQILQQMLAGLQQPAAVRLQADRALAIEQTVVAAADDDVILLAGKGHENYQEIRGVRQPFSDLAVARQALRLRPAARTEEAHP
jgi:UDP-N-acetylmuramoyl-L-alanyl-D-glutamate--2,6-diaminopimelate ligase